MKRITVFLLFISSIAFAQKSVLYNKQRQLIVDTTFHIDEHTYQNLPKIESEVLPLIYRSIPLIHVFPGRPQTDVVIVKLSFNKGKCQFETLRSKNGQFESAVYIAFNYLKKEYESYMRNSNEEYLLYVPIKFETRPDSFRQLLGKNDAITIEPEPFVFEGGFPDSSVADGQPIHTPKLEKKP